MNADDNSPLNGLKLTACSRRGLCRRKSAKNSGRLGQNKNAPDFSGAVLLLFSFRLRCLFFDVVQLQFTGTEARVPFLLRYFRPFEGRSHGPSCELVSTAVNCCSHRRLLFWHRGFVERTLCESLRQRLK